MDYPASWPDIAVLGTLGGDHIPTPFDTARRDRKRRDAHVDEERRNRALSRLSSIFD